MAAAEATLRLPLFPLPNVVHFPATELQLHIFEPRYRQMIRDLLELDPGERRIGMVLTRPSAAGDDPAPPIFPEGTAGRLIEVEYLPDGRSNIVLQGEFRFRVVNEIDGRPYRQAQVEEIAEEVSPRVALLHDELVKTVSSLALEIGERFPISEDTLQEIGEGLSAEASINRIAAEIDMPILNKMALLSSDLDSRAGALLELLRSRRDLMALLAPFRRFAENPQQN